MSAKDFHVGSLVWAKMKGYPAWPGKIIEPPADIKSPKQRKPQHCVYFFGTNNHAWVLDENIVSHDDRMLQSANKKKSFAYQRAIDVIVNESKNSKTKKTVEPMSLKEKEQIPGKESSQSKTPNPDKMPTRSTVPKQNKAPKQSKSPRRGKAPSQDEAPNQSKMLDSVKNVPIKRFREFKKCVTSEKSNVPVQRRIAKKRPLIHTEAEKKRSSVNTDRGESSVSHPITEPVENDYADLFTSVPPNMSYSLIHDILTHESCYHSPGILSRPEYVERPPTPVLDVTDISETLKNKEITPCSKKIGFLGLGNMGQGIVKNLLNSGHHVTVWNRTPAKMDIFLNAGASRGQTPADVVQASDITFCCVSDPDAVKCLVFGNCGVLKGLDSCPDSNKGYVEMTSIDPETSKAVGDEITLKGGRYLEAPIVGSRQNSIEGTLYIFAAGDRTLFTECETCFRAMGKDADYIGSDVGTGAKMNLIHSMLLGTFYTTMAEAMALVDGCKLSQDEFLKIYELGPWSCKTLLEKGNAIIQRNYITNTPLKHMQKDINLGLTFSDSTDSPLPITAAAHEVYKRAKQLRYADHDVSAIYEGIIY